MTDSFDFSKAADKTWDEDLLESTSRVNQEEEPEVQEEEPKLPSGWEYGTTDGEIDKSKITTPVTRAIHKIPALGSIMQGGEAAGQGVGDFTFDALGAAGRQFGIPFLQQADEWWDKHNPKSDDPIHTLIRDASAIVVPTLVGGKVVVGGLQGLTATRHIPTATRTLASIMAYAGVDTSVAAISSQSYEQDNMIGALNNWFGWNLPGGTQEGMDPDKRRRLHMYEAAGLSVGIDILLALASFGKAIRRVNLDQKAIAIQEAQIEELRKLIPADQTDPVTDTVQGYRNARQAAIDAETIRRVENPSGEPYDAFINQPFRLEQRTVSPDSITADAVGFKEDIWRIQNNSGTIDGVPRPAGTRELINSIADSDMANRGKALSDFFDNDLSAKFDLKINNKVIPSKLIDQGIDKLTDSIFNPDINFKQFQRIVNEGKLLTFQGRKFLSEDKWIEASYAWKKAFDTMFNPSNMKASAALTTQAGSEISTTSRAIDLISDIATDSRQWEMISEKMKFLVGEVAANQEIGRRAIELRKLTKAKDAKGIAAWLEDTSNSFDDIINSRKMRAGSVIDELERIAKNHPGYLRAFTEAYDATNGNVDTLYKLHRFAEESLGVIKKGIYDRHPEMPSIVIQGLQSLRYNNVLNGLAPVRAFTTNSVLSLVKPISVFAGAAATGDVGTFKRAMYTYGGFIENIKRGFKVLGDDWRLANSNPELALRRGRAEFKTANMDRFQTMESYVEALRHDVDAGDTRKIAQIAAWNVGKVLTFWNNTKFQRFGINALYSIDGFLKSLSASGAARAKAYDTLFHSYKGAFDKTAFQDLQRHLYNQSFDSTGKLVNKAAKFAADEFALNLDSNLVNGLETVLNRVPAAKALFMFPRTGVNAVELAWSFNPASNLGPAITRARRALRANTAGQIAEVMSEHGLENTIPAFKALQSEYIGRQLMGSSVVMGGGIWALEGNLTGNGPQDPAERSRMIRLGWKPRSIRNPFTGKWHSYEGFEPFETILSLTGDIVFHANRVDQSITEDWFRKLVSAITMNTTNDTFASGFEPLVSLYSGDEGAWNRFMANQANMMIPGTGLRSILNNTLSPQLRDVENDFLHFTMNNWKFMQPSHKELPNYVDVFTGKPIRYFDNWYGNAGNGLLPMFKQNGGNEPWRQWLLSTGWDGLTKKRVNDITGGELSAFDRQWINNWIGKHGGLKEQVIKLMNADNDFYTKEIKEYKKNLGPNIQKDVPIKETITHRHLDHILSRAYRSALSALSYYYHEQGKDLRLEGASRLKIKAQLRRGDSKGASETAKELLQYK